MAGVCTTECVDCRWAEMTPRQQVIATVRGFFPPTRQQRQVMFLHQMGSAVRIMSGGALTDYERHRQRYEQTGDPAELRRMLRHVKEQR